MAIMKVWDGTAWKKPFFLGTKVWNGSAWVQPKSIKYWDGSAWKTADSLDQEIVTNGYSTDKFGSIYGYNIYNSTGSTNNNQAAFASNAAFNRICWDSVNNGVTIEINAVDRKSGV